MAGRHPGRHPPPPPALLSRPASHPHPGPQPRGLPKAASRGCCPCNPSGLPGGAAGRSGRDHRRWSQPPARAADWEVSPEGGRRGAGDPGERDSGALNPPEGCRSKTLVQRHRRCGWGRRRGLARAEAFPVAQGARAPCPRTPGCQLGCGVWTTGSRESRPSAPTGPSWNCPLLGD